MKRTRRMVNFSLVILPVLLSGVVAVKKCKKEGKEGETGEKAKGSDVDYSQRCVSRRRIVPSTKKIAKI